MTPFKTEDEYTAMESRFKFQNVHILLCFYHYLQDFVKIITQKQSSNIENICDSSTTICIHI